MINLLSRLRLSIAGLICKQYVEYLTALPQDIATPYDPRGYAYRYVDPERNEEVNQINQGTMARLVSAATKHGTSPEPPALDAPVQAVIDAARAVVADGDPGEMWLDSDSFAAPSLTVVDRAIFSALEAALKALESDQ